MHCMFTSMLTLTIYKEGERGHKTHPGEYSNKNVLQINWDTAGRTPCVSSRL